MSVNEREGYRREGLDIRINLVFFCALFGFNSLSHVLGTGYEKF